MIDKTKNEEKVPSLEVAEVALLQCNLVDLKHQQKYNTHLSIIHYVKPSNSAFLKTYNTEFHDIIITFTDQNGKTLKKDKVNFILFINQ